MAPDLPITPLSCINPPNQVLIKTNYKLANVTNLKIQNISTQGLLDTGATISCINKKWLLSHLHKYYNKYFSICNTSITIGNNEQLNIQESIKLYVQIHKYKWRHTFHVVPNLPVDVVLGLDFLNRSEIILNVGENYFHFQFDPDTLLPLLLQNESPEILIASNPTYTIDHFKVEYPDVLTTTLGVSKNFKYDIKLKPGVSLEPIKKTYHFAPPKLAALRQEIKKLLDLNIIQKCTTDYASPAFLVHKKTDTGEVKYRLVIDYRQINKHIQYISYPLPTLDSMLNYLSAATVFTTLDLTMAFHQVPLTERSRKYTAFKTQDNTYFYNRLPQGIATGGQVLSQLVNNVFEDIKYKFLLSYLDDLLIYSSSMSEHYQHLNIIFTRLRQAGLTLNPDKIQFAKQEIKFLGYTISQGKIILSEDRITALLSIPKPKTAKQVAQFIGSVNYFARFIPNFSQIAAPLNDLRRKRIKFNWTPEAEESWEILRKRISSPPILALPDFNKQFHLFTDASKLGIAGMLCQYNEQELLQPIYFASRKLNKHEINYSIYQLEFLSVVHHVLKFRAYLECQPFVIHTDHSALQAIQKIENSPIISRWILKLMPYTYTVQHISGKSNCIADMLSRHPLPIPQGHPDNNQLYTFLVKLPTLFSDFASEQAQDPILSEIIAKLKNKENLPKYKLVGNKLTYQIKPNTYRYAVPTHLQPLIYSYYHIHMGVHLGINRTIKAINKIFYWPNSRPYITNRINNCIKCLKSKPNLTKAMGKLSSIIHTYPGEVLYIDLIGPLVPSQGYTYILICVDGFSRFMYLLPIRKANSQTIINALKSYVFQHNGLWSKVVSDNATYFTSTQFKNFLFTLGIQHIPMIRHYPNPSFCERMIQSVKLGLRANHAEDQTQWVKSIFNIQLTLNNAQNESLKTSPAQIFMGRLLQTHINVVWDLPPLDNSDPKYIHDAYINLVKSHKQLERTYNKNHKFVKLNLGDKVLIKTYILSNKDKNISTKLSYKFTDPYEVTRILSDVTYQLQSLQDPTDVKRAHISQLKIIHLDPT